MSLSNRHIEFEIEGMLQDLPLEESKRILLTIWYRLHNQQVSMEVPGPLAQRLIALLEKKPCI